MKDITTGSFSDLSNQENKMLQEGLDKYGDFYQNALDFTALLGHFIKSIDDVEKYIFIAFLSQIKKHHTLAFFSAVRLHHVQANMNLRQVLEATSWAAYAMAHKEQEKFIINKDGLLDVPELLKKDKNKWIEVNYPEASEKLKNFKNIINRSVAHSSLLYSFQNFVIRIDEPGFDTPFFDFEDEYKVKNDLWFISNVALGILDLFHHINKTEKVYQPADDFLDRFRKYVSANNRLKDQMMEHPRFKKHVS